MNPHQPLIDQLYREEILHARKQTPQQRVTAAFELAPFAHGIMIAGIRRQHPHANEEEVWREACRRIAIARRLSEHDIYRPIEVSQ
jgi:hypothetical protein